MKDKITLWCLILMASPLLGGGHDSSASLPIQELRAAVQEVNYKIHAQMSDMRLLEERMAALEMKLDRQPKPVLSQTASRNEDFAADLRLLKQHLEKTQASLALCEKKLNALDTQLDRDIGALKSSLQSMVTLLKGESPSYTVQPGDSLGKIAQLHKTTSKKLKEINHLTSDTIYPGQKLIINN